MSDDENVVDILKAKFRSKEFPLYMEEALTKIDELTFKSLTIRDRQQYQQRMKEIKELIAEFVFHEVDSNGASKTASCLMELQIMNSIADYMHSDNKRNNRCTLNTMYASLFASDNPRRMKIAVYLISFAISFQNIPVLTASTVLLQTHSYYSAYSLQFMEKAIFEIELLLSVNTPLVVGVADIAPIFTANFLTRLVEKYRHQDPNKISFPPSQILVLIIRWLEKDIRLCNIPVMMDYEMKVLPTLELFTPTTPHFTLIAWCIMAHLEHPPTKEWFARLEILLMASITTLPNYDLMNYAFVICEDLITVVDSIKSNKYPERQQEAINFLIKVIRGFLLKGLLAGSTRNLKRALQGLPFSDNLFVLVEEIDDDFLKNARKMIFNDLSFLD